MPQIQNSLNTSSKTNTPLIGHDMWVVLADKKQARVMLRSGRKFEEMKHFDAPEDMDDGLDNSTVGRAGAYGAGRHKYEPGINESRQVEQMLARDVAVFLEDSVARRDFAELAVVAPPQMLGEIRKCLSKNVLKTLVAESDKNLMALPAQDLQEALLKIIPGPDRI